MKVILLGDLHFGIKQFSIPFLQNQLAFFKNQLFPYMIEHNIDTIWQMGDFFDHRTSVDIQFLDKIQTDFFDILKENNLKIFMLTGNHDIYFRHSREITLIEKFAKLYPDNFFVLNDRKVVNICEKDVYVVPWITKSETLDYSEIKEVDAIFGHFEIANFEVVKGHLSSSGLTQDFFSKGTKLQNVFSGHFHIKNSNGFIHYLGTPYQLNWGDYNLDNGFYVWDGKNTEFINNTESKKFIKLKYNDSLEKPIEIKGLYKKSIFCDINEFKELLDSIINNEIKFFINVSKDRMYDEYIYELKKVKEDFTVIDNQSISSLIETSFIDENFNRPSTKQIITETIINNRPDLESLLLEIFSEVESISSEV